MKRAFVAILQRDLQIAFRRVSEIANPLLFFIVVASLFPLAVSPDSEHLRSIGSGVLWVVALLSSLLALEGLFRADAEDGSLEQLMLSPVPLGVAVLAKVAAHWLVTIVPLVVLTPVLALSFALPVGVLPVMAFALLLATPTLSVLVALGAALTLGLAAGWGHRGVTGVAADCAAADFRNARDRSWSVRRIGCRAAVSARSARSARCLAGSGCDRGRAASRCGVGRESGVCRGD